LNPAGTIGDRVWRDVNSNRIQDVGEPGIPGVQVTLTANPSGGTPVTYTDQNGYYLFEGLFSNGTYTVVVTSSTLPTGFIQTHDISGNTNDHTGSTNLTGVATNNFLLMDFGYKFTTATIDGSIWNDYNRNGAATNDTLEPMLSGVTVHLISGGLTNSTVTTDTNGYFRFTGLSSGTYEIKVNATNSPLSTNWVESFDTDGIANTNTVSVTVATGGATNLAFSYYQAGTNSIGDQLFYDWNGDGLQSTNDEGIASITVYLYQDRDSNGVFNSSIDVLVATTVTATNGTYSFTNLPTGRYLVVVNEADSDFPPLWTMTKNPSESGVCTTCNSYAGINLTNANTAVDFGYKPTGVGAIGDAVWYDANGDNIKSGSRETNLLNISLTLQADFNNDGVFVTIQTNNSSSSGYQFTNLPAGKYRVVVGATDPDLPSDSFGYSLQPSSASTNTFTLANGQSLMSIDFGFYARGVVGDKVFWDANDNGTQDFNETGISNVVLKLFLDANTNRVYDPGETLIATTNTDTSGTYQFTGISPGNYVVVVDQTNSPAITNAALAVDPSSDGLPCSDPLATGCDGQYGFTLTAGGVLTGVDFGYKPSGLIGDSLWLDTNNNGERDTGELGLAFLTVELRRTSDNALVATNVSDTDGYYYFTGITNGTYKIVVLTNNVNFPSGAVPSYDPDGVADNTVNAIVMSGGAVASIGGQSCTNNCDLAVDVGYRFAGTYSLSGTIGLDGTNANGTLGSGNSGVNVDETPLTNVTVYIYRWSDTNNNSLVSAGETVLLGTTTTGTNGDYSFTNLPTSGTAYIVSLLAPMDQLRLTTTQGVTPATVIGSTTNAQGDLVSCYQVVPIAASNTGVDFAFALRVTFDYGDLPSPYPTLLAANGARHVNMATNLILGALFDTEINGQPTATANGDDTNGTSDEDGVVAVNGSQWREGANGGTVQVTVLGSGYLVGWIDFNGNGSFVNSNDMVINQAVSAGTANYSFTIPGGTFTSPVVTLNLRFRLFPSAPPISALAFNGAASRGEVEDYQLTVGSSNAISGWVYEDGGLDTTGDLAFGGTNTDIAFDGVVIYLYHDYNQDGVVQTNELLSSLTPENGSYSFANLPNGHYLLWASNTVSGVTNITDIDGTTNGRDLIQVSLTGSSAADQNFLVGGLTSAATKALVTALKAYQSPQGPLVWWRTASEVGSVSFDLYRYQPNRQRWLKVNTDPVPAENSLMGGDYQVLDPGADPVKPNHYYLYETDEQGLTYGYGPFETTLVPGVPEPRGSVIPQSVVDTREVDAKSRLTSSLVATGAKSAAGAVAWDELGVTTRVRLTTRLAGLHRLSAATLATLLGQPESEVRGWLALGKAKLTNRGNPVAGIPAPDGSALYFHADKQADNYTDENVYWLETQAPSPLNSVDGQAPAPRIDGWYSETVSQETNSLPVPSLATSPEQDYWFWSRLRPGSFLTDTAVLNFTADQIASGTTPNVVLTLRLQGGSTHSHAVLAELNGVKLEQRNWQGPIAFTTELTVPAGILRNGANTLKLKAVKLTDNTGSQWYVNGYRLQYTRQLVARNGALELAAESGSILTVSGFATSEITVADLSQSPWPVVVTNVGITSQSGGWAASFVVPHAGRYAVFQTGAGTAPSALSLSTPSNLASATNEAAYVVITHAALQTAAIELATYRQQQGLATRVVTVNEIYDEFNWGLPSPQAINRFLTTAYRQWSNRPAYAVLAGNGTYDYRNLQKVGDNLVPPGMISTPFGLFNSDAILGDVNGDGLPEIAIGRLPAVTEAGLRGFLTKLQTYEAQPARTEGRALLISDTPYLANDFAASATSADSFLAAKFSRQLINVTEQSDLGGIRTALQTDWNNGVDLVTYLGHGAVDRFGAAGYLTSTDVPTLQNASRLPVVVAATCLAGQYAIPAGNCLAEDLVMSSQAGAIAMVAPSGLSYNGDGSQLNLRLVAALQANDRPRLGDLMRSALVKYAHTDQRRTAPALYNLIGDPALVYNLSKDPTPENLLPQVMQSGPTNVTLSTPASFQLRAEAYDNDGSVVRVEYFDGDLKVGESFVGPHQFTLSGVAAGQHEYRVVATDDFGARTTSTVFTVMVTVENQPPLISLAPPTPASGYDAPVDLTLAASATDADGGVVKVEFFNGETKVGEALQPPYTLSLPNLPAGSYQLMAVATDNQQARVASDLYSIQVLPFRVLAMEIVNDQIHLRWAGGRAPYVLEGKASLSPDAPWEPLHTITEGTSFTTALPATGTFFRLRSAP
jgi:hypothetical protein